MAESLNGVFALLIFVTVALTAVSIGLVTTVDLLRSALGQRRVVAVVLLNCVVVPLVGYLISGAVPLSQGARTGVVICAICAGGPLALKVTQIAKGDLTWSLSLTVVLLMLNVVTLPLWSALLIDGPVALRPADLVGVLGAAILIPVGLGMAIRPRMSDVNRWFKVLTRASNALLVVAIAVGLVASSEGLVAGISSWLAPVVLAVVVMASWAGWAIRDERDRKRASTLSTLNRATSVALLIVGRVFADQIEILTAVVLFGLVQTVIAVGLALYWGAAASRPAAAAPVAG